MYMYGIVYHKKLIIVMQAVFNFDYGPDVPEAVREGCAASEISLLNAEKCLFYRYNQLGWIKYVWALGLLAAGQSSTMTVSEGVWLLQCMELCIK